MYTYLVEVEHQVKLADIPEESIQHLDEEMYRFQICQLIVVRVDAGAEEQASVPPVYDLGHVSKLDEVRLVLLVARCYEAMHLVDMVRQLGSRVGCGGQARSGGSGKEGELPRP